MTAGESTSGRLDLSFGGQLLTGPFAQLATGLRWMFWGLALQMVGAMGLIVPFAALLLRMPLPNLVELLPVTILIWLIGGLIVLWGEQKCLHLELPFGLTRALPGQSWLRAAYFCQLASILIRFARRVLPAAFVVWISIPCQILGFVFLLLFLRRLAEVIARDDLRRLIDTVFLLAAASLVIGAAIPLSQTMRLRACRPGSRPTHRLPPMPLPCVFYFGNSRLNRRRWQFARHNALGQSCWLVLRNVCSNAHCRQAKSLNYEATNSAASRGAGK
jgi:hypothetical protein